MSVEHYENFPVASWLCPPALRPAITAIYRFARTADDIADEGDAGAEQRLNDLAAYRCELRVALAGGTGNGRWPQVFGPLSRQASAFRLPALALHHLLDAFEQDVRNPAYPDRDALLGYCQRSAAPVGRLLLHLYGIDDALALARSDAVCNALQLINFWQDLGIDAPRGRHYVPLADLQAFGVTRHQLEVRRDDDDSRALVRELCAWARALMEQGAPLVRQLPGRAGWELRLVVQGGLRVLDKIESLGHSTLAQRPTITAFDAPRMAWRAWRMQRRQSPQ